MAIALASSIAALDVSATPAAQDSNPATPRVALVLSGGGARGLAHIGVIRELERQRVPIGCIVGTSMGGIVGGLYAAGMPIDELEARARAIDWTGALEERPHRTAMRSSRKHDENGHFARPEFGFRDGSILTPTGVVHGQQLGVVLDRLTRRAIGATDFDRLPIPFRAIATDIVSGEPVVLAKGSLPRALRATMSVPGALAPVEIDDRLLIDGGIVDNLPVDVARDLCGEALIAVNIGTPLLARGEIGSAVSVTLQMIHILTAQNVDSALAALRPQDRLIKPELGELTAANFDHIDEFIAAGEAAARAMAPQLAALAVPEGQFAAWRAARDRPDEVDPSYDRLQIAPLRHVNPQLVEHGLAAEKHRTVESLIDGAQRVYEQGDFEQVRIDLKREDGETVAIAQAIEKSWGPTYLRFGLSMTAETGESTSFNAVVAHTRTWLNAAGGRWQNVAQIGEKAALFSEIHQPLSAGSPLFVAPRLLYTYEQAPVYVAGEQIARIRWQQASAALDAGAEIGHLGSLRVGVVAGSEDFRGDIGSVRGDTGWRAFNARTARLDFDTYDKAHFPTTGHRLLLDVNDARRTLNGNERRRRETAEISLAETWGQNTFSALAMSSRIDADALLFEKPTLGGFQHLSAYPHDRFRADQVALLRLGYQRNIPPLLGLQLGGIVDQTYFGGTLEAARITRSIDPLTPDGTYDSASVFIGADTILGPAAFSFGFTGSGEHSIWLSIGIPWTLQ